MTRRTYTEADWRADQQSAKAAPKGSRLVSAYRLRKHTEDAMRRHLRAAKRTKRSAAP